MLALIMFFFLFQVHQLPPNRDKHLPAELEPRPLGGAADTESSLGHIRPAGPRAARGSKPAARQEV